MLREAVVTEETEETALDMKLVSSAFVHDKTIPSTYTCDGENINPPLSISDVSKDTKSLALVIDDPDAPMGTWVHWTVWNIAPTTAEISENSVPEKATQGTTSFGKPGYGGPCPPSGTHRYFFKLFALDTMIELDGKATVAEIEEAMKGHILAQTQLIGRYGR
jgi:Raf kinase inhibitor-like YbhB/YbcL family protein